MNAIIRRQLMMDYTKYTVEDLASDDSFIHWANQSDRDAVAFSVLIVILIVRPAGIMGTAVTEKV